MELMGDEAKGNKRERERVRWQTRAGNGGYTQKEEVNDVHFTQDWWLLRGDLLEAVDRLTSPQLALLVLGQEVRHEVVAEL
jgi:hypothetical protein